MTTKNLTAEVFATMQAHPDYEGFGYIGGRLAQIEMVRSGEVPAVEGDHYLDQADLMAIESANQQGLTAEQFFQWANSKRGRWYADCWFGCRGQHAEKYLPTR